MFWRYNPLDFVNEAEARRRVELLKRTHPQLTKRELCNIVISRKSLWCAGSGAVTALPGVFPGLGTLLTLLGGTAFDIVALMYFMSEMVMEMALIYGRDLRKKGAAREAAWVFLASIGTDSISKNVSRLAVKHMGRQAFLKITQDVLISAGIRASQRSVLKIVPLLGAFLSGLINYYFCRRMGKMVADYYENNDPGQWEGITVDI